MPHQIDSVLVTGGGTGIGAALARELASRGRRVVVAGRRADLLEAVAEASDLISVCAGDVTVAADRAAMVAELADLPEPRAVFHGAGHFQSGLLDTLSSGDWQRSFDVNVGARWQLSRECVRLLDGGRVLFIGSDAGARPRSGAAAYSIAQAASETLRRALQAEWADRSVSVGAFKPGLVDTDMVRGFMQLSHEVFPARSDYENYLSDGEIAQASTVARFSTWLLDDVSAARFAETEWDIRDATHHHEWADGPLYPHAR